jgi:uncharacterized protein YecT (DUF1311 family)
MFDSMRFALVFLFFAILPANQDIKPAEHNAAQEKPCDSAKTQQEMNQCSGDEYHKADKNLNGLYTVVIRSIEKDRMKAEKQNDLDQANCDEKVLQKLKLAERAWIQYRDLHCDAARHQYDRGSISPMVWANCMKETTLHRIQDLRDAYDVGNR